MKRLSILLGLILVFQSAFAQVDKGADAESLYQAGDYQQAATIYESIVESGQISAALYFNLGNCYYKLGENTKAIIQYERSLILNPSDAAVEYNLKMARKATVDKIVALPDIFFMRWYRSLTNSLSVDGWAIVSVSLFILFLVMLALFLYSGYTVVKKSGFFIGLLAFVLSVWSVCVAGGKFNIEQMHEQAIITAPSVTVKGSPDKSGTDLFLIHEGAKVKIISSLGGWYNVVLQDGNEGWLPNTDLERI